jgi:uncharacterized membrane protein YfcA
MVREGKEKERRTVKTGTRAKGDFPCAPFAMQYKLAMERLFRLGLRGAADDAAVKPDTAEDAAESCALLSESDDDDSEAGEDVENSQTLHQKTHQNDDWIELLRSHSDYILTFVCPLLWTLLFLACVPDRRKLLELLFLPFLGIFAACLANCVPIGGGIVYTPAFYLLGIKLHLGVSFSVATMSIGNGLFGFLRWLAKDPTLIIWPSFVYTVIPSSIGSLVAMTVLQPPPLWLVKRGFAFFCVCLSCLILTAVQRGGLSKLISSTSSPLSTRKDKSVEVNMQQWLGVAIISFLAGLVLVPNIAVGPALSTYLLLNVLGYSAESSMCTGIITGGWVSIIPFAYHLLVLGDVPLDFWVMVLPGVWIGATVAPIVVEYLGVNTIMTMFSVFLFLTAILFALA